MRQSFCMILLFASVASAGEIPVVPLVNIDPTQAADSPVWFSGVLPASDESWGWAFGVERQFYALVTHVAWYDTDGNGLSHPHSVGIWRDTVRLEEITRDGRPPVRVTAAYDGLELDV